ncbi:unnamed protein product [Acanthosepion pharaonis]|uniref:Uncharacterized protein n=1 Tax=Acanthosepion pharaonis TaxID=158019 RepID=A0A812BT98_ACAPH|nr:unnamed protein product [Sepia pharaonis]
MFSCTTSLVSFSLTPFFLCSGTQSFIFFFLLYILDLLSILSSLYPPLTLLSLFHFYITFPLSFIHTLLFFLIFSLSCPLFISILCFLYPPFSLSLLLFLSNFHLFYSFSLPFIIFLFSFFSSPPCFSLLLLIDLSISHAPFPTFHVSIFISCHLSLHFQISSHYSLDLSSRFFFNLLSFVMCQSLLSMSLLPSLFHPLPQSSPYCLFFPLSLIF